MGRAEAGSIKALSNRMKAKGLQRLRWYCQICEKQMRDENGFKCHTQSEAHVRQMQIVAENPKEYIKKYSNDFLKDFVHQLRTSHGTKQIDINRFYQEYIANKDHIHMNSTEWSSLTQFATHLGKQGIATVHMEEPSEDGTRLGRIMIALIDNSPEALRRRELLKKKESMARGDEQRDKREIELQVKRAEEQLQKQASSDPDVQVSRELNRDEGNRITLNITSATPAEYLHPKPDATSSSNTPIVAPTAVKLNPLATGKNEKKKNPFSKAAPSSGVRKQTPVSAGSRQKVSQMEQIMMREMEERKRRALK